MRRIYPDVSSILHIGQFPDGAEIHLTGWSVMRMHSSKYSMGDGAALIEVQNLPSKYTDRMPLVGDVLYGMDIYVRVLRDDIDPLMYMWSPAPKTVLVYFDPPPVKCNCGASHTQFKDRHYDWCDTIIHSL